MKKILLSTALFAALFSACKKTETPTVEPASTTSTTPTTTTSTPTSPTTTGTLQTDMLNLVNNLRQKGCNCGAKTMPSVPILKWNNLLETAATNHAKDMATKNYFSHTGLDGSTIATRADRVGYKWSALGENIANGYPNTEGVFQGWLASAGHCENMMSGNFTEMGAARSGNYWVQEFGKGR